MSELQKVETALARDFRSARRAGVPIVAVETADPAATLAQLTTVVNGTVAIVAWDAMRGMRGVNKAGDVAVNKTGIAQPLTTPITGALMAAEKLPAQTVLVLFNAHLQLTQPQALQGVWNVRDSYKASDRLLVLLMPRVNLPAELKHDVIVLIDPLPDRAHLQRVLLQQYKNADIVAPTDVATIERSIDAAQGLSAFETEQNAAMSMTPTGLDLDQVWDRKCQAIASGADGGLRLERVPFGFDAMGGCRQAIKFGRQLIASRWFSTVWFIDEIEKDMSAMHTDTSGVTQFQHKALLTYTQRHKIPALLLIGQPGSGKTLFANAIAGEAGVPLAEMNLGALKGQHVGDTEQNTERALSTLTAVSQGKLLLVATCNDVGSLKRSPELLRRFKLPKFYFDLPTAEERDVIWPISGARYGVGVTERPDDEGWTGSEIDSCCETASRLQIPITAAADWIVPMAVTSASMVEARRQEAHKNYLSASYPGLYDRDAMPLHESRRIAVS